MIELVADAPCGKTRAGVFEPLAVSVLSADGHARRTADYAVLAGHTEAALCADLLALAFYDDGVNKLKSTLIKLEFLALASIESSK